METKKSLIYLRAKKKVEMLKHFYSHILVYILFNSTLILFFANVFSEQQTNFYNWGIYTTAFFWGIGLISHAIYVFFQLHIKNNFIRDWEDRKIKQLLEEDGY